MSSSNLDQQARTVAQALCGAQQVVALTGAGISVESGIPAFRGAQGLWDKYDSMEYASIEAFLDNPARVWAMLLELDGLVRQAQPNPAHEALAKLERLGRLQMVVTQNIDGLHQESGSRRVVEFHGSGRRLKCLSCQRLVSRAELMWDELPPRCGCGGIIKPDVVFFGEPIPERAAMTARAMAHACQVMLVVGTLALVAPASHLPLLAKSAGAVVVEINPEPTALTGRISDHALHVGASQALPLIAQAVEKLLEESGEGR